MKKNTTIYMYRCLKEINKAKMTFTCKKMEVEETDKMFLHKLSQMSEERFRKVDYLDKIREEIYGIVCTTHLNKCEMIVREDNETNRKKFKKGVLKLLEKYKDLAEKEYLNRKQEYEKVEKEVKEMCKESDK